MNTIEPTPTTNNADRSNLEHDYQVGDGIACFRPAPCLKCPSPCTRAIELYKSAAGFTLTPYVEPPPGRLARLRTAFIARLTGISAA